MTGDLPARRPAALRLAAALLGAAGLGLLLQLLVLEAVVVPTRSMAGAILPGDHLILEKLGYVPRALAVRSPSRGQVVALSMPGGDLHLKRCVAVAGDTIEYRSGRILVNGRTAASGVADPGPFLAAAGPRVVPREGEEILLDSAGCAIYLGLIASEGRSAERDGRGGVLVDGVRTAGYRATRDYLFVLGDNHALSADSRVWGFVPEERVVGTALFIYWSLDGDGSVRWDRIGTIIR